MKRSLLKLLVLFSFFIFSYVSPIQTNSDDIILPPKSTEPIIVED